MTKISEWIESHKIKKFESKMRELKPRLLTKWYEELDEQVHKEYEEEMERLHQQIDDLSRDNRALHNSRDYYKGKYEGVVEMQDKVQDKLINKIEQSGTVKGQLKQEVKQLKEEVAINKEDETKTS